MRTRPNIDSIALDTPKSIRRFNAEYSTLAVDKHNVPIVRALIARLFTQQLHKSLNLKALTELYRKELHKRGVDVPVTLILRKKPAEVLQDEVAIRIDFYKSPVIIKANLVSKPWLFRHNLLPALVSFLLILLTGGSLWYISVIIRRQLKLDRLKNEFISNITHELRTPLTILRSSNEAIAMFNVASDPEKLARYTGINSAVLLKLETEVERIMDISLIETNLYREDIKQINLHQLLSEIIQRFNIDEIGKIKLINEYPSILIFTDPYKIDTILSNLLDNALKYSGSDVSVLIEIFFAKNTWELKVTDTGKGISNEDLPLIFDKFYRVNTGDLHDIKGYGLGLSHVKGLVKSLKGKIDVKSKVGHGTIFTLKFPK